ncbi:MAG: alpha-amylase family glycosyl hydrolase [Candidatus Auribacterota bacterium]
MPQDKSPYLIYNIFPRLVNNAAEWEKHLPRIADMGFNWLFLNPFHYSGFSGSLYSIKDYYDYHLLVKHDKSPHDFEKDLKQFTKKAEKLGLHVIVDYVINHTAVDSILVDQHPDWYQRDAKGKLVNPRAMEGDKVTAVWGDLAEIDNLKSPDRDNLWKYWIKLAEHYLKLGFSGFRCDAAYQVPADLWKHIIDDIKGKNPDAVFFAETLGCELADTKKLIKAGFDVIFNSSKWWDFEEPWCLKQNDATSKFVPSVSFPESHDTHRLAEETHCDWNWIKTKYFFSAIFSAGVMIPVGFEFGFGKKLDVVHTTPQDWEETRCDLSGYIAHCNSIKKQYAIFQTDSSIEQIVTPNSRITALLKSAGKEKALIIINKDRHNYQEIYFDDIASAMGGVDGIIDVSAEHVMDSVPNQFHYNLMPGQIKVLYAKKKTARNKA